MLSNLSNSDELNIEAIAREHRSGVSLRQIAIRIGRPRHQLSDALLRAGHKPMTRAEIGLFSRAPVPVDDVLRRHKAEESVLAIARALGFSRPTIVRVLKEHGRVVRSRSESLKIRNSGLTPEQRSAYATKAHDAVRGMKRSEAELHKRALTRQANPPSPSEHERHLHDLLLSRGIEIVREQAIGPYNCDFGASPVAVEVFGGDWHWSGRHLARKPKRVDYILNAGWQIVAVHVTSGAPISEGTADYLACFIEEARRNPPLRGEYRVIRRAGELVTLYRPDGEHGATIEALKPPSRSARNLD
jgi:very-short-patch-repair endonuclease